MLEIIRILYVLTHLGDKFKVNIYKYLNSLLSIAVHKWISPYPEIKKSHSRKNYWDQIEHACEWLTLCKTINRQLIENVRSNL